MDSESERIPLQAESLDDVLVQIATRPKRKYSQQEIDEARDNLVLMNDRVFFGTFTDNKNNHIIKGIADALRKIHALAPIPEVERTTVQKMSLLDVLGRGMVGDLLGEALMLNIALEVQKGSQDGYAVRGTITSGNAMRIQFNPGDKFTEAPDVIGINILGFRLPELENQKIFCSRIVRAEYDTKELFLEDRYSDYYIELPKMNDYTKEILPEEYHDLWDICCIFKAKIKEHEEVIRMQSIVNPTALNLSDEVRRTVARNDVVNETLDRRGELLEFQEYVKKQAQSEGQKGKEEMIITAFMNNVSAEAIEAMRKNAGITEARLDELKKQAQSA